MILFYWTLGYALPAATATYLKTKLDHVRDRIIVIHVGILLSIAVLSLFGLRLTWHLPTLYIVIFLLGASLAVYLLRLQGMLYVLSVIVQEYCILLAGSYLAEEYGIAIGSIATALVFTFAHRIPFAHRTVKDEQLTRFSLLFCWGVASILLYAWLHEPVLNIGLHAGLGAVVIYRGWLFTNRTPDTLL